jgi:hypothetical protein
MPRTAPPSTSWMVVNSRPDVARQQPDRGRGHRQSIGRAVHLYR